MHLLRAGALRQPAAEARSRNRCRRCRIRKANRRRRRLPGSYRPSRRLAIGQQQQIEAMLEPESRLREQVPPPAPPALQRVTVNGKRDAKTRQTRGAAGQQDRNQKEHRRDMEPTAEVANRGRQGSSPAPPVRRNTGQTGGRPRADPAPVPTRHADSRRGAGGLHRSVDTARAPAAQQDPRRSGSGTARHDDA